MRTGFDEVIHPLNRLQICAMLSRVESLSFAAVRDGLGVSDSVLSKQLKVLQEAGYVTLRKESFNSRIHAWVALTPLGRTVFTAHMAELRRVADEAVADKAVTDEAVADKAVTDGAVADGAVADGAVADGAVADGAVADGAVADGAVADGAVTDDRPPSVAT